MRSTPLASHRTIGWKSPAAFLFLALLSLLTVTCGSGESEDNPAAEPELERFDASISPFQTVELSDDFIEILPQWQVGDRRELVITKSRSRTEGVASVTTAASKTPFTVEVLEAGSDGYLVRWSQGTTEIEPQSDPDPTAIDLAARISELAAGMEFDLEIDPFGSVSRIRNWEAVSASLDEAMDLYLQVASLPPDAESQAREILASITGTEEELRTFLLRDVELYHVFYGLVLSMSDAIEFNDELPNPLGGAPFNTLSEYRLLDWTPDTGIATIEYDVTVIDEDFAAALLGPLVSDLSVDGQIPEMALSDLTLTEIDVPAGLPKRIEYTRTITAQGEARTDTTLITDVTNE